MCFTKRTQADGTLCSASSATVDTGGKSEIRIQESSQSARKRTMQHERNTLYNIQEGL